MKEFREEDFLLLSGIQHYTFCKRQWALIHIENQWVDNIRTVEGNIFHEHVDDYTKKEKRGDLIVSRGMRVFSRSLGITGICDAVELHKNAQGVEIFGREGKYQVIPIEYKKGKPKEDDSDVLQLCAQAMCLEDMLVTRIEEAFIFYGEPRRRLKIILDEELRDQVKLKIQEMHQLFEKRYTPKVKMTKHCKACSLVGICLPKLCANPSTEKYIEKNLSEG
jgi:CRISPR-associated exonuclease Cas4